MICWNFCFTFKDKVLRSLSKMLEGSHGLRKTLKLLMFLKVEKYR